MTSPLVGGPGAGSRASRVSCMEGWLVGLVWAPVGQARARLHIPGLCVPTAAATVAPKFLPNMTKVTLPEDLPLGE